MLPPAGVVKMRRGQVATFMLQVQSMKEVYQIFHQFATTITLKYALEAFTSCIVKSLHGNIELVISKDSK